MCTLDICQANEANAIQQQMNDVLREMDRVKFQFYQQSQSLCESIIDKYTDNYYSLLHYIPKLLKEVYTININNNKQIDSINDLLNLNKLPDDIKNNELLNNILMSSNQNQLIQDINKILATRKQIDNLREIFENLETRKIQIIYQRYHKNNKVKKEKN